MPVLPLPDYTPIYPPTKTVKPRQRVAKLPDWGIEQRSTQGQNQTTFEWSVKWILSPAEANNLDAFLVARAKSGEAFLWLPPSGNTDTFRCDTWTKTLTSCNIYEVQATFRQLVPSSTITLQN
jgi:phage-related protein